MASLQTTNAPPAEGNLNQDVEMTSSCAHCGSHCAPRSRFCCQGCAAAAAVLDAGGWQRFYDLRGNTGRVGGVVDRGEGIPPWLDAAVHSLAPLSLDTNPPVVTHLPTTTTLQCQISGLHCAACSWLVPQIAKASGAADAQVNAGRGTVALSFDPDKIELLSLITQLKSLGYKLHPLEERVRSDAQRLLIRTGLTVALAANTMLLSLARYLGLSEIDGGLFIVTEATLMSIAVIVGGSYFLKRAFIALKNHALSLDVPIALGIALGSTGSVFAFFFGLSSTYFDTVTIFIALMLAGRAFQALAAEKAQAQVRTPRGSEQWRVRRLHETTNRTEVVDASSLRIGQKFQITPGDIVLMPCATTERASFSFEWTDGEPEPRTLEVHAQLSVGARYRGTQPTSLVVSSPFEVEAMSQLLAPRDDDSDVAGAAWLMAITRAYPWAVLSLASVGGALWATQSASKALEVTIATLVITCPCALGLAIPLAYELAAARAHDIGVLIRKLSVFDRLCEIDTLVLDKTGTASLGELRVTNDNVILSLDDFDRFALRTLSHASNHPRSRAIATVLDDDSCSFEIASLDIHEVPGDGVEGIFSSNGKTRRFRLGRRAFANPQLPFSPRAASGDGPSSSSTVFSSTELSSTELSSIELSSIELSSIEGSPMFSPLVEVDFDEQPRPGAAREVALTKEFGVEVKLLSGDSKSRVRSFAQRLGISSENAIGEFTPAQKADYVVQLRAAGKHVFMLGDGLNDASALDEANVKGAPALDVPASVRASDLACLGRDIVPATSLFSIAHRLRWVIRANVIFAIVYNGVAATCALLGWVTPLFAAVWMPAGSIFVVVATLLAFRGGPAAKSSGLRTLEETA